MRIRLRVERGGKVRTLALGEGAFTVGRAEGADLPLDDQAASREHLRIEVGDKVRIEDLGSRNGTLLGGGPLRGAADWRPGEVLTIGDTSLSYGSHSSPRERWQAALAAASPRARLSVGIALVLLALVFLFALLPGREGDRLPRALRLDIEEAEGLILGRDPEADRLARERIEIEWHPRRAPAEALFWLHVSGETSDQALRLRLNGVEVFAWEAGEPPRKFLLLPASILRERNLLAFETTAERWAIWNLRIEEAPRPRCARADCLEQAARLVSVGRQSRERRAIDPANLQAAFFAFRDARILLEGLEPRPDLYATAVALMEEAGAELDAACRDLHFGVVQSLAFGREEQALHLARRMQRSFPAPDHPCHERAADLLQKLEPWGDLP